MGKALLPLRPKGHSLSGHLSEMRRDLLGFYQRSAREYGDCICLLALQPDRPILLQLHALS